MLIQIYIFDIGKKLSMNNLSTYNLKLTTYHLITNYQIEENK